MVASLVLLADMTTQAKTIEIMISHAHDVHSAFLSHCSSPLHCVNSFFPSVAFQDDRREHQGA